ncbi:MAG: ComEC/Rec2 family competence protein [Patescibacteria group bacterium]
MPLYFFNHNIFYFSLAIVCLVAVILFWKNKIIRLIFLTCLIIFFALWRYGLSIPNDSPDKIWHYNGRSLELAGVITNEPDIRESFQKLEVEINYSDSLKRAIKGKILITTNLYPTYSYGDQLAVVCKLIAPEKFDEFAYNRYLARYNIYSVCYYPRIKVVEHNQGNWFYQKIFIFKSKLFSLIDYSIGDPEASLTRSIAFGGQRGLDEKIRQQFSRVGLTHIMAVSGFNVGILAIVVLSLLLGIGFSRRQSFYLSIIILLIYIILVGAPASAMRAGLMGFLVLWALHLGRLNKITNALVLTATILLLINPKLLRDDIGFQLSFCALAGLIYVSPFLENFLIKIKIPELKGLRSCLAMTLSAQIFTWPISAYNFSQISLIAPLANLLVIWLIPFLTIVILIALPASFILPSLSSLFFLPALFASKYILFIVQLMSEVPHSYLETAYVGWIGLVVYYIAVIVLLIYFNNIPNKSTNLTTNITNNVVFKN